MGEEVASQPSLLELTLRRAVFITAAWGSVAALAGAFFLPYFFVDAEPYLGLIVGQLAGSFLLALGVAWGSARAMLGKAQLQHRRRRAALVAVGTLGFLGLVLLPLAFSTSLILPQWVGLAALAASALAAGLRLRREHQQPLT